MKTTTNLIISLCVCFTCFSGQGSGGDSLWNHIESFAIIHFSEEELTQKFRAPFGKDELLCMGRGLRAKIAQDQEERSKIFPLLKAKRINKRVASLLTDEIDRCSLHNLASSLGYTFDALKKFALFSSTTVSWGKGISLLKELTGKGEIFPNYSLEDAVSILFLKVESPIFLYKEIWPDTYSKERDFYTNCLAFALKKFWETTRETTIMLTSTEKNGKSAAENILTQIYNELYHQD